MCYFLAQMYVVHSAPAKAYRHGEAATLLFLKEEFRLQAADFIVQLLSKGLALCDKVALDDKNSCVIIGSSATSWNALSKVSFSARQ